MRYPEEEVLRELMAEMGSMDGERAMRKKGRMPLLSISIESENPEEEGAEGGVEEPNDMERMGQMSDEELGSFTGFNPMMVRKMIQKRMAVR